MVSIMFYKNVKFMINVMTKILTIFGLCLLSNIAHADSWGAMKWGKDSWGPDSIPEASYDFGSGLLTIKNVDVGGQHYYVELQNQGFGSSFAFALGHVQPLDHASNTNQSVYNGVTSELNIPHVFAGGNQYFSVNMKNDNLFIFRLSGPPVAVRSRSPETENNGEVTESGQVQTEEVIEQGQIVETAPL